MTNPSDPGQGPWTQQPGPYGPPPQQHPGHVPAPRQPQQSAKGVLGALFDADFNHLVTPKLIKLWYIVALLLILLQCLIFLLVGVRVAGLDDNWGWGVILVAATPLIGLFELIMVRILLEGVVVRFKQAEHLKVIRDKL